MEFLQHTEFGIMTRREGKHACGYSQAGVYRYYALLLTRCYYALLLHAVITRLTTRCFRIM